LKNILENGIYEVRRCRDVSNPNKEKLDGYNAYINMLVLYANIYE
jgi:hypothetical protein